MPVAVNQLNGIATDGEKGEFIQSLGKRNANYFQIATADGKLLEGGSLSGVNGDIVGFTDRRFDHRQRDRSIHRAGVEVKQSEFAREHLPQSGLARAGRAIDCDNQGASHPEVF